jgi:hypothetical protein
MIDTFQIEYLRLCANARLTVSVNDIIAVLTEAVNRQNRIFYKMFILGKGVSIFRAMQLIFLKRDVAIKT